MSDDGDRIMKLQRKVKAAKKVAKDVPHKRHAMKLDKVLAARGIKDE